MSTHKHTKSSAKNTPKKFSAHSQATTVKSPKHEKSDRKKESLAQSAITLLSLYINKAVEGTKMKLRTLFSRKQVRKSHAQ